MNAIAGKINFNGQKATSEPVLDMLEAMQTRGPAGGGVRAFEWAALGALQGSEQPLADEQTMVVCAGDKSGAEILHAYREHGAEFAKHLDGAFAAAIYDVRSQKIVLVRDKLGLAPLYYARTDEALYFASTLPALLKVGGFDTSIDPVALHHYMSWHSIVPGSHTLLRGVTKLPAASTLVVNDEGTMTQQEYWSLDYKRGSFAEKWDMGRWVDTFYDALRMAILNGLKVDPTAGALLSGGLDSSLIVALMHEITAAPFNTFSIGFQTISELSGDEFYYSDLIAKRYETNHHKIVVSDEELLQALPGAVSAMSEPMASHDATAFYLLSQNVAGKSNLVMSGQGADEVFGGYNYHQHPSDFKEVFFDYRDDELRSIIAPEFLPANDVSGEFVDEQLQKPGAQTELDALLRLDTHHLMVDDPVKRVDNMMQSHGVNAHMPFLDLHVVECAANCPPELKNADGGKAVLKELGRRVMPNEVIDRPKGYFPVPTFKLLQGEALTLVRDTLTSQVARQRGLFNDGFIDTLLAAPNDTFEEKGRNTLWTVAVLEMWLQANRL